MNLQTRYRFLRQLGAGLGGRLLASLILGVATAIGLIGLQSVAGGFLTATAIAGRSLMTAEAFDVVMIPGLIRVLALGRTVGRWSERMVSHDLTFRFIARLRLWIFDAYHQLPTRLAQRLTSADLFERFTKDVHGIEQLIVTLIGPIGTAIVVAGLLVLAWSIHDGSGLVLVIGLGLLALVILPTLAIRHGRSWSPRRRQAQSRLRQTVLDLVDNLDDFSLNSQARSNHLARAADLDSRYQAAQAALTNRANLLAASLTLAVGAIVLALIGHLATVATVDAPIKVGLLFLLVSSAEVFAPLYAGFVDSPGTAAAIDTVRSLGQATTVAPPVERAPSLAGPAAVAIENLAFSYDGQNRVFHAFSCVIAKGEQVFLTGPSGGGKSTLARLITGLERPSEGSVRIGDQPVDEHSGADLVAYATQDPYVFAMTVAENLRVGNPTATDQQMLTILAALGLDAWLQGLPLGLATRMAEDGASLSGGQKRRLGLARTLLRQTPVVLLDEPTEGLDEAAGLGLAKAVRAARPEATLVWISHRLAEATVFDRMITLDSPGTLLEAAGRATDPRQNTGIA